MFVAFMRPCIYVLLVWSSRVALVLSPNGNQILKGKEISKPSFEFENLFCLYLRDFDLNLKILFFLEF
jgi:hypothetical protein